MASNPVAFVLFVFEESEEAVAWRAWLRSFLELLLRDERDEAAMKAAEITLKHLKTAERCHIWGVF